jgi:predicted TPR repeat methyltransferase
MVLFNKKKKDKFSLLGFLRKKFLGNFDIKKGKKEIGSILKKKIQDGKHGVLTSKEKLKDVPGTNYKLGLYHMQQGNLLDAIFRFNIVCRFNPANVDAHYQQGRCYYLRGDNKDAKQKFNDVLKRDAKHDGAQYFIQKIETPEKIESMPPSLIKELVNLRDEFYEEDYLDNGYMGAKHLVNETFKKVDDKNPNFEVLDLGCGTGLCGVILKERALAKKLIGVDLSSLMVKRSKGLEIDNVNVYDEVHEVEISEYLTKESSKYDLVIADLAFDFIGKLDSFAELIKSVIKKGGLFGAVVRIDEELEKGYKLDVNYEDFSHSEKYFTDTFVKAGFEIISANDIDIVGDLKGKMLIFRL